jgi:hypothetical protein
MLQFCIILLFFSKRNIFFTRLIWFEAKIASIVRIGIDKYAYRGELHDFEQPQGEGEVDDHHRNQNHNQQVEAPLPPTVDAHWAPRALTWAHRSETRCKWQISSSWIITLVYIFSNFGF